MAAVPDTLARIGAYKLEHIAACKAGRPYDEVAARASDASPVRGFLSALKSAAASDGLGLIAEIKKASPSKGLIGLRQRRRRKLPFGTHRRAELSGRRQFSRRRPRGV